MTKVKYIFVVCLKSHQQERGVGVGGGQLTSNQIVLLIQETVELKFAEIC